jgi:hypothetical protein
MVDEPDTPAPDVSDMSSADVAATPQQPRSTLRRFFTAVRKAFAAPEGGAASAASRPAAQRQPAPKPPEPAPVNLSSGSFDFPIVGESYRQRQIRRVAALAARNERGYLEFDVTLRREPTNKADRNAIAVFGPGGNHLGYFAREDARVLNRHFWRIEETGRHAVCRGIIIGENQKTLGVVLDLDVKRLKREWRL